MCCNAQLRKERKEKLSNNAVPNSDYHNVNRANGVNRRLSLTILPRPITCVMAILRRLRTWNDAKIFRLRRDFPDHTITVSPARSGGAIKIAVGINGHATCRLCAFAASRRIGTKIVKRGLDPVAILVGQLEH